MTKLIHWPIDRLKPKGGPAGYLYNLKQGLEENNTKGFEFLPSIGDSVESITFLQRIVPRRIKELRRLRNLICLPDRTEAPSVSYENYTSVHFHSTEDLYLHRKALEDYSGKVILTSHSPCAYHQELISRLNQKDVLRNEAILKRLEDIDEYAFKRADWIIFPCREAEEPYFHTWKRYEKIRDASKIEYCPSGTKRCIAREPKKEVRCRFGIPDSAFVISYVGRHNEIKGYSDLVDVAPRLLSIDNNIWILVAGKESPLSAPSHPRWIEAGWTDDPHSIIAAADLFVLPNRETYFDLVMLEALSLGQIVAATATGGNRYFEKYRMSGIMLYDGADQLVSRIEEVRRQKTSVLTFWREENRRLFESDFSCRAFAERYSNLIDSIEIRK